MAYGRGFEALKYDHFSHILRDVLGVRDGVRAIVYGEDTDLMETMRRPEHGIETWMLYTSDAVEIEHEQAFYWEIGINGAYFGEDFCDLFVMYDYAPVFYEGVTDLQALRYIYNLMATDGLGIFVNSSMKVEKIHGRFRLETGIADQMKQYGLLYDQNVVVVRK